MAMPRKKIYEDNSKEIRAIIPTDSHEKLRKIRFITKAYSNPEALVNAIDIAADFLKEKDRGTRPDIVDGRR